MKKFSLKVVSIVMVLCMIYGSMGCFVTFKILQYKIRKEVKRQIKFSIPENQLVNLYIPKSVEFGGDESFVRIHKGEFRYKGQMYDIIRYQDLGDTTLYTCFHDVKESGLFDKLDKMVRENSPNNPLQHSLQRLSSTISILYFEKHIFEIQLFASDVKFLKSKQFFEKNHFSKFVFKPPCC